MKSTPIETLRDLRARDGWRKWSWTNDDAYTVMADGSRRLSATSARRIRREHGITGRQFQRLAKAGRRGSLVTAAKAKRLAQKGGQA